MSSMDDIVALCRRRGFIFQSSELYGGINGFWDYGPLGAQLKRNLKDAWWRDMVMCPPHMLHIVPVDTTIIMHPEVWQASGHVESFNDPRVDCKKCKARYRADHLNSDSCPNCGGELTEPRQFNLMFETNIGAVEDKNSKAYLRPETAQGIFTQFWNVVDSSRVKIPFGIAQQGKAFRNEVTPRNFTYRSREFEQMEVEFFLPDPDIVGEDYAPIQEWYDFWKDIRYRWWLSVGLSEQNLRLREHDPDELAHYAQGGVGVCDVEYCFPFTAPDFGELEGIAHRTNYDLKQHAEYCGKGKKLRYFDQQHHAHYFPHVIEPSAGIDRGVLALLCDAYTPDDSRPSKVFMKFAPRMAPITAGVFPLVNKPELVDIAYEIYRGLSQHFPCQFDVKQNIGKRYARMDEAGTPYCITVDNDTLQDDRVTIRHRDTQKQERIPKGDVLVVIQGMMRAYDAK